MAQLNGVEQVGIEHAGGVGDTHALKALLQLGQLIDGFLHQLRRAINTAAFFHRHTHFIADFGPVFIALLIDEVFQTVFNVVDLRIQRRVVGFARGHCALHSLLTGKAAKDHQLGERVGSQTVGAVQADGGTFAHGEQALDAGFALLVGLDTPHGVVGGRAHRNGLFHRIDADIGFRQFADER